MSEAFAAPVDIANRALQKLGQTRITAFTDDSKAASEAGFIYDKVRRAELRRNVWRFAIRVAVLRALDTDSRTVGFPAWAIGTTYAQNFVVLDGGQLWYSKAAGNIGHAPSDTSAYWTRYFGAVVAVPYDSTTTYYAGDLVYVGSAVSLSLISNNSDTPPSSNWLVLTAATLTAISIIYPIGSGPFSQNGSRNVYQLPNGYLKKAPQAPKAGSYSLFGSPGNIGYDDWAFQDNYIVANWSTDLIIFRFVADIADVSQFDDMFCEGLACRIGVELCEPLTQSVEKAQMLGKEYDTFMSEARTVNCIETGPVESPLDDYLACRY